MSSSQFPSNVTFIYRNIGSGALFGMGFVAFMDEAVFHQLLHWHHFYDQATSAVGLISDGLFHAFSWFATVGGLFMLADLKRRNAYTPVRWWGGFLIGAGGFQLYDGTVQHKILRIHQIRYDVDVFPYDFVWNMSAVVMILLGLSLVLRYSGKHKK